MLFQDKIFVSLLLVLSCRTLFSMEEKQLNTQFTALTIEEAAENNIQRGHEFLDELVEQQCVPKHELSWYIQPKVESEILAELTACGKKEEIEKYTLFVLSMRTIRSTEGTLELKLTASTPEKNTQAGHEFKVEQKLLEIEQKALRKLRPRSYLQPSAESELEIVTKFANLDKKK